MNKAYVNGVCHPNPGQGAYAFVILNQKNRVVDKGSGSAGSFSTNNTAEYYAIIKTLDSALKLGLKQLTVFSKNQVVVRQIDGIYAVNSYKLEAFKKQIDDLKRCFTSIQFMHVPRKNIFMATSLTSQYFDSINAS